MPAPDPISLRNPRAAEVVARELRRQIVRGELPAGHALPSESALTEQFEVSRPTLREAFRVLEHEGLVEIRRGVRGGARVRAPDENLVSNYAGLLLQYRGTTIADLFGARAALEAPAARMLAARPSRKEIVKRLGAETEEHANDLANPARAPAFHRLVVELTGNQTLILLTSVIEGIAEAAEVSYERRAAPPSREARQAHRDHEKLVALIQRGAAAEAEAFWHRHLVTVGARLQDLYGGGSQRVVDVLE